MSNTSTLIKRAVVDGEDLVCVAPWYWDEMNSIMGELALATPQPIDVEKLKRETRNRYENMAAGLNSLEAQAIDWAIDHLAAQYDFVPKNGGKE